MSNEVKPASNGIRTIGVKVPVEFHDRLKASAENLGISLSDFIRDTMEKQLSALKPGQTFMSNEVKPAFDALNEQLAVKDQQIQKLQQELTDTHERFEESRTRSDSIIMQLSKTLENQQSQIQDQTITLEDLRQKENRSWWQKWFGASTA